MRNNDEAKLQIAFANFMRYAYPWVTHTHVVNEGSGDMIRGKMMKDRGVLAGNHDNFLWWHPRNFASLELKREGRAARYSPKQSDFAGYMDAVGFPHACCNSGATIMLALTSFGLPATRYRFPPLVSSEANLRGQYITMVSRGVDVPLPRGQPDYLNPFAEAARLLD